jgi:hypothetical protein
VNQKIGTLKSLEDQVVLSTPNGTKTKSWFVIWPSLNRPALYFCGHALLLFNSHIQWPL